MFRSPTRITLILAATMAVVPSPCFESAVSSASTKEARVAALYGKLPVAFEANKGQADGRVKFLLRGGGYSLFLTPNETVIAVRRAAKRSHLPTELGVAQVKDDSSVTEDFLRVLLDGANNAVEVSGEEELPGKRNYFIGNDPLKWRRDVPTFAKVRYKNVFPDVDLVYYGNQGHLEYDFVVAPGADLQRIRLRFRGAEKWRIGVQGELVLEMKGGELQFARPEAYQEQEGKREVIEARYVLERNRSVRFQVGPYDRRKPLIIDPVLVYSTYLGRSGDDYGQGIAVDSSGNAYVTGYTSSSDFPTANAFQASNRGSINAFVTKINANGSELVYSTYLGGADDDRGKGIAVDSSGNAYVTGSTTSTNFPTVNAFQSSKPSPVGRSSAFVTKLNASGSTLAYSTYLGGDGGGFGDSGNGIAVDSSGNAYVTGYTQSSNFPTVNAFQSSKPGGGRSAFVTKFNADGLTLAYSTYLAGSTGMGDSGNGIAVDSSGHAYVVGTATSGDFPTVNAFQSSNGGGARGNAFVTKFNADGSTLAYSTYLGGSSWAGGCGLSSGDSGNAIAVDSSGSAYVTGSACSINFPTVNPFQSSNRDVFNAFITKFNPGGSTLAYSTYLGGSGFDDGYGIAVDSSGNAYVTGATRSPDFPTANAIQASNAGGGDVFVTKINASGSGLVYSTYLGGGEYDIGNGIAVDAFGYAYVTGHTRSTNFPTRNALKQSQGAYNAFVLKIQPGLSLSANSLTFSALIGTTSAAQTITLTDTENTALTISSVTISGTGASDFAETDNCVGTVLNATGCGINVTFRPMTAGTRPATLSIAYNAVGSPQAIPLTGMAQDFSIAPMGSSSATIAAGQTANFTLAITPAGGFNQTVTLSCTGAPAGSNCTVPSQVTSNGYSSIPVSVLTLSRSGSLRIPLNIGTAERLKTVAMGIALILLLLGAFWFVSRQQQAWLARGLLILIIISGSLVLHACGGGSSGSGTPASTYTLTITANSQNLSHQTNLTVIVQ